MPVSISNLKKFERSYKILINPKTSPEKKTSYYTEQTMIISNQTDTLFLLQVFDCIEMAAEEFVLNPKHVYIRDQPPAAQILLDNSIKHKKPQLSYLNRLRPLKESARTTTTTSAIGTPAVVPPTPEPPIVAKADNNPQKQALLLTSQDDDDDDDDVLLSLVRHYPQNVSCYNYSSWTNTNLSERKKFLKLFKNQRESK